MKNSLIPIRQSKASLRLGLPAVLSVILAIGFLAPAAKAQSSVIGQWRTAVPSGTITINLMANGQYTQVGKPNNGDPAMAQNGPYQLIAPNTIVFSVTDYSPKSRIVLVPCGIPNNPTCNVQRLQNIPKPPGSRYAYSFSGPNTMIFRNEQAQETLTLTRVP
ncbi:MAG TPA: hypothetical protein VMT38_00860 [Terracidiphilus sp.]|nr:hypothetical protein [Terracidiphilus sp.]